MQFSSDYKYSWQLLQFILKGGNARDILYDENLSPAKIGHIGEAMLRICCSFGIEPGTATRFQVELMKNDPESRRIEIVSLSEIHSHFQTGLINSGGNNKIDVCYRNRIDGYLVCCSSKFGKKAIRCIKDLEIALMKSDFESGYTENGVPVDKEKVRYTQLVANRKATTEVIQKSRDKVLKEHVLLYDVEDLDKMCCLIRSECQTEDVMEALAVWFSHSKPMLRPRFHQELLNSKMMKQVEQGAESLLLGAIPRSGKTWMAALVAKEFDRVLVITTRPSETRNQWVSVFRDHQEFCDHQINDIGGDDFIIESNKKMVCIVSIQFCKKNDRSSIMDKDWGLLILDEVHSGGCTEMSESMIDRYVGINTVRLLITATYEKPIQKYSIPEEACFYWDLEDSRLMRSWGQTDIYERMCKKHGQEAVSHTCLQMKQSGETDETIRNGYAWAPRLCIMTTMMNRQLFQDISSMTGGESVYGFSMRSLFMMNPEGTTFQNASAVDCFLESITGSNKMVQFPRGDMSFFARIRRQWKQGGHREGEEFMAQIWFLPFGVGLPLEGVKQALQKRMMNNSVLCHYAIHTLDAGSTPGNDVSIWVRDAKAQGKRGAIFLTGNVASMGVSLPEVDVAFLLHDGTSADMVYQQMMRVMTESPGKKYGTVVDFNMWRILSTMNTYVSVRCHQEAVSSEERIRWCVSNLIDVDSDLWECLDSPESVSKEFILEELTNHWNRCREQVVLSLKRLSMTPCLLIKEDQDELERIMGDAKTSYSGLYERVIEVNPEQSALPSGVEVRKNSKKAKPDKEEKEHVDMNGILARLLPLIRVISGCRSDLLEATRQIDESPDYNACMTEFINTRFSKQGNKDKNTFSIFFHLMKKNYEKLTDAREIYDVMSNRLSLLDSPEELVAFLGQHLEPKQEEKKDFGEVFTPPKLIEEMLDRWTIIDPTIWSDPARTYLDPANGIGNFPALIFHRLMQGLTGVIPDPAQRKRHILENMIYMCELNGANVEMSRKIFDPEGKYKLNLFHGSFFDLDPQKVWGKPQFDAVLGNPPYQPKSNGKKGGKSLWPMFVRQSIEKLMKPCGYLAFVHPALWRQPENELHDLLFSRQIHFLSIHNKEDGAKTFQAGTRYDWYILENKPSLLPTGVRFEDGTHANIHICSEVPYLMNRGQDIMETLREKAPHGFLQAAVSCEGHTQRDYIVKTRTEEFSFPIINAVSMKHIDVIYSKRALKHQTTPKVVFSNALYIQPLYDPGHFGTTQGGIYIPVQSDEEGIKIARFLKSKLVSYIIAASKWSNFATVRQIFWSIPHPTDLPPLMTDEDIYRYFDLNQDQIDRIEQNDPGPGLAAYKPRELPLQPTKNNVDERRSNA
jgi:superfamily II DNA or RNA helicase